MSDRERHGDGIRYRCAPARAVMAALVVLVVLLVLVSLGTGPVRLSPLTVIERCSAAAATCSR